MQSYEKLKKLLAKEKYPHPFPFKFIGKNTPGFLTGIRNFESKHPTLKLNSERKSKNNKHLSVTYILQAESAEIIIEIFQKIEKIQDLILIL